jgi:integrase
MTDIYKGIDAVENGNQKGSNESELYSKNFVYDTVTIIKPFYVWLTEAGYSSLKERDIPALKRPKRDLMTKTVADILTEDEIKKIIHSCESVRDRAILMLLYDGGFRIGELGKLTWGQSRWTWGHTILQNNDFIEVGQSRHSSRFIFLFPAAGDVEQVDDSL